MLVEGFRLRQFQQLLNAGILSLSYDCHPALLDIATESEVVSRPETPAMIIIQESMIFAMIVAIVCQNIKYRPAICPKDLPFVFG